MAFHAASVPQRLLVTALWVAGVAGPGRGPWPVNALAAAVLGVEPGHEAGYEGSTFRCLNGAGDPLPATAVNDEMCDCADGSDEPGTGACAGQDQTLFFCQNKGSIPQRIYASRVGDGVCDCCDGTDEVSLAKRHPARQCADRCAEEGAKTAAERQEKIDMLKRAIARQGEIREEGLATRTKLQSDMDGLKAELPALESALEAAHIAATDQREAENRAQKEKEEAEQKAKEAAKAEQRAKFPNCKWRQTEGCKPDGERQEERDKDCDDRVLPTSSGFCDCDGDGQQGAGEKGYTCDVAGGARHCFTVCMKGPEEVPAAEAEATGGDTTSIAEKTEEQKPAGEEEKPQVSEYSKWMEGAEKEMSGEASTEATAEGEEKPQVSEYSKWMDGAEDKMSEEKDTAAAETDTDAEGDTGTLGTFSAGGDATIETEAAPAKEETAVDIETKAQTAVTEHNDKINNAQADIDNLADDKLGYANLHDRKLSKHIGEWNYDIEFFSKAAQDSTSLGSWSKWTGPRSALFEEGTMCWGGPARSLIVKFVCGEKEEILDVFEPSRCVYEATIEHPGACDEQELETIMAGKVVRGPKDEL